MDTIQEKWIASFVSAFQACQVREGELAAILSETESRPILVKLAELALLRLKARPFHVVVPTPPSAAPVPDPLHRAFDGDPGASCGDQGAQRLHLRRRSSPSRACCIRSSAGRSSRAARASSW